MKHPTRTARASGGLRALAAAALDLTEARKAFREEMRRRAARALDGLGLSSADLGRAMAMDAKRVTRYRDPGPEGIAAPWWAVATLPPTAFRAALAALEEMHRELHGLADESVTREQHCLLALESTTAMESRSTRALMGDMRIDDAEARTILPEAQRALRRLRGYVVALGGDPDADGAA